MIDRLEVTYEILWISTCCYCAFLKTIRFPSRHAVKRCGSCCRLNSLFPEPGPVKQVTSAQITLYIYSWMGSAVVWSAVFTKTVMVRVPGGKIQFFYDSFGGKLVLACLTCWELKLPLKQRLDGKAIDNFSLPLAGGGGRGRESGVWILSLCGGTHKLCFAV